MGTRRLRTANYPAAARERLGDAVAKAREAAGYRWRTDFAPVVSLSVRVLAALEGAEPTVGQNALHAVGRALPGWTEDTPRLILEGGPIPSTELTAPEPEVDINEEMLRHLHQQRLVVQDMDASDAEIDEYLDLLLRMWTKKEPDSGRRLRTVRRFREEVEAQESDVTVRKQVNGGL